MSGAGIGLRPRGPLADLDGDGAMTRLVEALRARGLAAEVVLAGRWATIRGERCAVHVVETRSGDSYLTWCDDPDGRTVECYRSPDEAIQAGLQRAARQELTHRREP